MFRIDKTSRDIIGKSTTESYEIEHLPEQFLWGDCEVDSTLYITDNSTGAYPKIITRFIPLISSLNITAKSRKENELTYLEVSLNMFNDKYIKCLPQTVYASLKITPKGSNEHLIHEVNLTRLKGTTFSLTAPLFLSDASDITVTLGVISPKQFPVIGNVEVFPDYPLDVLQIQYNEGTPVARNTGSKTIKFRDNKKDYILHPWEKVELNKNASKLLNSKYQKKISPEVKPETVSVIPTEENTYFFIDYTPISKTHGIITKIGAGRSQSSWDRASTIHVDFPGLETEPLIIKPRHKGGIIMGEDIEISFTEPPIELKATIQEFSGKQLKYRSTLSIEQVYGNPEVSWGKILLQPGPIFRLSHTGTSIRLPEYYGNEYDAVPFKELSCILNIKGVITAKGNLQGSYWSKQYKITPEEFLKIPDEIHRIKLPEDTRSILLECILVGSTTSFTTHVITATPDTGGGYSR